MCVRARANSGDAYAPRALIHDREHNVYTHVARSAARKWNSVRGVDRTSKLLRRSNPPSFHFTAYENSRSPRRVSVYARKFARFAFDDRPTVLQNSESKGRYRGQRRNLTRIKFFSYEQSAVEPLRQRDNSAKPWKLAEYNLQIEERILSMAVISTFNLAPSDDGAQTMNWPVEIGRPR